MKQVMLVIALLSAFHISAQSFDFYALAGPAVSQIDGDRVGGYNKLGAIAGIGVAHSVTSDWQALMELEYVSKGKASYAENSGATYTTALHYIQLPILAKYELTHNIHVESGLSLAFLMSYQFYEDNEPISSDPFQPLKFDFDWLLGATYTINEYWKVNLRFAYSILHMNEISDTSYYRPNIWKHPLGKYNRTLTLAMQYWF